MYIHTHVSMHRTPHRTTERTAWFAPLPFASRPFISIIYIYIYIYLCISFVLLVCDMFIVADAASSAVSSHTTKLRTKMRCGSQLSEIPLVFRKLPS